MPKFLVTEKIIYNYTSVLEYVHEKLLCCLEKKFGCARWRVIAYRNRCEDATNAY
jgi:hypothetical protein